MNADRIGLEVDEVFADGHLHWSELEDLKDALLDHGALVLRAQHLDEAAHRRLLRRFGPLEPGEAAGPGWESPGSDRVAPPKVLSWRATRTSGDVVAAVADVARAYRSLTPGLRALADRSWGVHGDEGVAHPVTRLHPETGDRGLLLGAHVRGILELPDPEGSAVVGVLQSHVVAPSNVVEIVCHPGDVVLVDARAVQVRLPAGTVPARVRGDAPLGVDGRHSHALPPARRSA